MLFGQKHGAYERDRVFHDAASSGGRGLSLSARIKGIRGILPVILFSLMAFQSAFLIGSALLPWEYAVNDVFVRWRYFLLPQPEALVHPDVAAVGIDSTTVEKFGRFGSGSWITRRPYVDQLLFMDGYLSPSVLAYDIILEDALGQLSRQYGRVTESGERLERVIEELEQVKSSPGVIAQAFVLDELNRFSIEQGNDWLANTLAKIRKPPVVLGYFFRGGWMDPQVVKVRRWSDQDVFGESSSGDEEQGERIPYLTDLEIPAEDIYLDADDEMIYEYAPNAKLPGKELLDYSLLGFVNCPRDADGVVRRVPMVSAFRYVNSRTSSSRNVFVPSLAMLSFLVHAGIEPPFQPGDIQVFFGREIVVRMPDGGRKRIPVDGRGRLTLNFNAAFDDFKAINFLALAPSGYASEEVRKSMASEVRSRVDGKIVILGVSTGVDSGPTPLSSKTPFMHIHLTAVNNILTGMYLRELSSFEKPLLYALLFLVVTLVCCLEKSARLGPAAILLAAGYFAVAFIMIYGNLRIIPVIMPMVYIALTSFSVMTFRFFTEEKAKRKIRGMFSTMVSDKVLAYLEQNPGSFSLQGHKADVSVMFSDVKGFTSISEQLPPERLTALLNRYFNMVTDCIMGHGGYLDKYVGDGVMAVWGAPFADDSNAQKACRAALEQVRLLAGLNSTLKEEFGFELTIRLGINTGPAIAGNMGSFRKFQYTVMGDTINLASRLEPANKDFGTSVIIGPETKRRIGDEFATRMLARIIVKGKTEALPIYELIGLESELSDGDRAFIERYDEATALFLERKWDDALAIISSLEKMRSQDGPLLFLRAQVELMKHNPPPPGWQGDYIRKNKD